MIKFKIHSVVDVITNSSTTIYTFQNSIKQTKELVQEVINLMGIDKTPDDVFYYGVFAEDDGYLDNGECPENFKSGELEALKMSIMKGDTEKPEWMKQCEDNDGEYGPSLDLCLIIRDEKYKSLGVKIENLLSSVDADGGFDG